MLELLIHPFSIPHLHLDDVVYIVYPSALLFGVLLTAGTAYLLYRRLKKKKIL